MHMRRLFGACGLVTTSIQSLVTCKLEPRYRQDALHNPAILIADWLFC